MQCVGSALYLKGIYGVGYTLTIVKDQHQHVQGAEHSTDRDNRNIQTQTITDCVKRYVPVAEPLSVVGAEQSFRLPFSASERLANLFEEIDSTKAALGVAEYGISVTTLEEVFMRVGKSMHQHKHDEDVARRSIGHENPVFVDAKPAMSTSSSSTYHPPIASAQPVKEEEDGYKFATVRADRSEAGKIRDALLSYLYLLSFSST